MSKDNVWNLKVPLNLFLKEILRFKLSDLTLRQSYIAIFKVMSIHSFSLGPTNSLSADEDPLTDCWPQFYLYEDIGDV